jgi:hypothetical protein
MSKHWSWGIISSLAGLLLVIGISGLADLLKGEAFASTLRANLADPNPFYVGFACVGLLIMIAIMVWDYRHRTDRGD